MKPSSLSRPAALAALFATVAFAIVTVAQDPQAPPPPPRTHSAPTNLKVLPKTLTGEQVHDIMEQWEGSLGANCETCHKPDPNNLAPNGKPRLNFADDSKPEKAIARQMYLMTEDINKNYISKIDNSGAPVTCGTCHRGHIGPQPFAIPGNDEHRRPQAPPPSPAGADRPDEDR